MPHSVLTSDSAHRATSGGEVISSPAHFLARPAAAAQWRPRQCIIMGRIRLTDGRHPTHGGISMRRAFLLLPVLLLVLFSTLADSAQDVEERLQSIVQVRARIPVHGELLIRKLSMFEFSGGTGV